MTTAPAPAQIEVSQLPVWTVAALQDDLLTATHDLDRLQGLLTHACETLIERFSGASENINLLLNAEQPEAARCDRLYGAIDQLGGAMTALQFQDMASQLIHHTHTRLRGCADQLAMRAFGAELVLTPKAGSMEFAIDTANRMQAEGRGLILNQFGNADNPLAHYEGTGPEIWRDTAGQITHFVSSMGTTGTIMGCSRYLKEQNAALQVIGVQPEEGSQIPGIRKWPEAYLPKIYDARNVDRILYVTQADAEETTRRLAREEGIFAGISSGGALAAALKLSASVQNATIVSIVCDRGDRYLSTGVFPV